MGIQLGKNRPMRRDSSPGPQEDRTENLEQQKAKHIRTVRKTCECGKVLAAPMFKYEQLEVFRASQRTTITMAQPWRDGLQCPECAQVWSGAIRNKDVNSSFKTFY